jgi:alpha-beta hydrolase superfamily lysophospholipase
MRRLFSSIFTKTMIERGNGVQLAKYVAQPANVMKPVSYMGIMHGYAEHMGYYEELAATLTSQGFYVFGYDRRGCGYSTGVRGLVSEKEVTLEDFLAIKKTVCQDKIHVLGNSHGGCLALHVGIKHPEMVRSIITVNPALDKNEKLFPEKSFKVRLVRAIINSFLINYINLGKFNLDNVTSNKKYIDKIMSDKLHYKGPLKGLSAKAMLTLQTEVKQTIKSMKVPWLLELCKDDICVDPDLSRRVFNEYMVRDKRLHESSGGHDLLEVFEEPRYPEAVQSICSWLHGHS